ncbi:hypothetical protein AAHB34_11940 [Paenarthrobacter ureafaciens]
METPKRQLVMAVSVTIPAVSAAATGVSIFARPRNPFRITVASIVLLLTMAAVSLCWAMRINELETFETPSVPRIGGHTV